MARYDSRDGALYEVPVQVYAERRTGNERRCRLVFLAEVPAHEHAKYLIFYGNPNAERADYTTDLRVCGDGYGLDIANAHYRAILSRQTGQIERIVVPQRAIGRVGQLELVEVVTPEEYMGDIIGDLNSRRGQVGSMDSRGNARIVEAMVPLANMFGYVNTLRSMSQGRATFTMVFDHYDEVPQAVADEVVAKLA